MQMRRPSQTGSPSPRDALGSPSHAPSLSPGVTSARSPGASAVDRQSNLALGSPPVWRRESEQGPDRVRVDQLGLGRPMTNGPPGTPARKASGGMDYGSSERSPGYGLGISSPSSAGPSQPSVGPGGSPHPPPRMSRVPSRERMQASLSPRAPFSQPSPRPSSVASPTASPFQQQHAKSPSVPLSYFPSDPARRPQDRQTSDPNLRASQSQENVARRGMSVGDDRTWSSGSPSGSRVAGERKISVSLERDGSDPAISIPLSQYPSATNGKPASTPPARPRHASADLILPPQPRDGRLSTPPHTTIERARNSRLISGGSPAKPLGVGRASVDENAGYRAQLLADRRSGSGDVGKPRLVQAETPPPKNVTPRKSSGVLRSLFGKKKESPAPSPPVAKPAASPGVAGEPSTPSRKSMQRDFEPPSRPSPVQLSTTPPNGRMSRPRTGSSPTVPTTTAVGPPPRRPSAGPDYQLSAPPPPQIPLPSLLSTDSTGLLSSSDSIPSLQQREGAGGKKAVALLRRLSDQSSHSASSLSYLASSEPSAATNEAPSNLPHFKSSGSLRLLALPDFGGSLDLGEDVDMLAEALRQPTAAANGDSSFQPQLDGEDSWSSLLAAMSSGSPELISAAFEGARQSIAIQNNSELEKALADLQLEVNKQVSNLPASRSLDLLDTVVPQPPATVAAVPSSPTPSPPASPQPEAPEPTVSFPVSFPAASPPTLAPPLPTFGPPFGLSAPVKNPNLTIKVVKPPPSSFKSLAQTSVAPLKVAKRTLSAPTVSPDQPTSLYAPPTTNESLASPTAAADGVDQAVVMSSASLPSLRTKPALRPASSSGRVLTIAAARRQRRRKLLNYRVMAEKMGDCLVACVSQVPLLLAKTATDGLQPRPVLQCPVIIRPGAPDPWRPPAAAVRGRAVRLRPLELCREQAHASVLL